MQNNRFSHKMKLYFYTPPPYPPFPPPPPPLPARVTSNNRHNTYSYNHNQIYSKPIMPYSGSFLQTSWRFVFPRLGFITKGLSAQADLCFLESSFGCLTALPSPRLILQKHSAKFKVPLYCYPYYCGDCFILNDLMFFRSYAQIVKCERKSYFCDSKKT